MYLNTKKESESSEENVRVQVRCRPALNNQERKWCVQVDSVNGQVSIANRDFYYDEAFSPDSDNDQVYAKSVRTLVESSFLGYNCTCFLYGQTGTGKTFTNSSLTEGAFKHFFELIRSSDTSARFLIRVSYYELYNEDIRDLLSQSNKALELRESESRGVYVKDLSCHLVNNIGDLQKLKAAGDKKRVTAATQMNEHSSRSHSIFAITIETVEGESVRVGRLNMVDLAGSERQAKSGSKGARLKEASKINLSLTCLSLVIRSLTDPKSSHIPYRNSKLTRLLSSSLGGNSKTLLIACISGVEASKDETLNTLRFASRAKKVKNRAKINEDARDALLREYKRQVEELRLKLSLQKQSGPGGPVERAGDFSKGDDAKESADLAEQLEFLKAKIMVGGENLLEKAELHERLLESSRQELQERKAREALLKEQLEAKQAAIDRISEFRDTLEGESAYLEEKLERAQQLYRQAEEELKDLTSEHQDMRESLLESIRATSKEIKYADCIIEAFIPRDYLDLINNHAHFDYESDEWQIKYVALSGNNLAQTRQLSERSHVTSSGACTSFETLRLTQRSQSLSDDDSSPFVWLKDVVGSQMRSQSSIESD